MNDTANKVLIELLNRAVSGIDAAVQFSQAQLPDVIHQLLLWNSVSSLGAQLGSVAGLMMYAYFLWKITHLKGYTSDTQDVVIIVIGVFGGVGSLFLVAVFFCNFDWLKIWLSPKLYLLEYAASLVKGAS